jgi:glucan-binding YG repeat protein
MHKKVKHIIAASLVVGVVSGVLPANDFILGSTKAYASTHHYYDDEDDYDDAYLDGIYLSDGTIDFSKTNTDYSVNVGKDTDKITVRAKPAYDDFIVDINDSTVEENDHYEKTVSLVEGKNVITIDVESDDDKKAYTLEVYRGGDTTTSATGTSIDTKTTTGAQTFIIPNETNKFNAWNRVDEKWMYLDGTGQALKNTWWFDKNTGINYYLDKDGYRTTGWLQNNNNWYYFNENGEMKTDWISSGKNWYYLNKSGVMKMGWLEDSNGNWYYLDNTGAMKTGWLSDSDGKWYYLDSTGKMIKDSTVSGYNLDSNGVLSN